MIVEAGVALIVDAEAEVGRAGTGDENAQIRRENDVGELAGDVVAFDGTTVERDHKAAAGDRCVGGEMNLCRGANVEIAAARELEVHGLVVRSDGSVVADEGEAVGDGHGTTERNAVGGYGGERGDFCGRRRCGFVEDGGKRRGRLFGSGLWRRGGCWLLRRGAGGE